MTTDSCPSWCLTPEDSHTSDEGCVGAVSHVGQLAIAAMRFDPAGSAGQPTDMIDVNGVFLDLEDAERLAAVFDLAEAPAVAEAIRHAVRILAGESVPS